MTNFGILSRPDVEALEGAFTGTLSPLNAPQADNFLPMEYLPVSCPESQLSLSWWEREINADKVIRLSTFMNYSQPHLVIEIQQRLIKYEEQTQMSIATVEAETLGTLRDRRRHQL